LGTPDTLGQGTMVQVILEGETRLMFKENLSLSEVFRMTDLIKEVSIDKYSQEEYRQILNEIVQISITDYDSEEVQNEHLFSPS
jgi:hypothetical protein